MTTEKQPGDTNVQHTQIESRQLQAEFLHGNIMDSDLMSVFSFPKSSIDGCAGNDTCSCSICRATNDGYRFSIAHC